VRKKGAKEKRSWKEPQKNKREEREDRSGRIKEKEGQKKAMVVFLKTATEATNQRQQLLLKVLSRM
jgi:hypothetical protein